MFACPTHVQTTDIGHYYPLLALHSQTLRHTTPDSSTLTCNLRTISSTTILNHRGFINIWLYPYLCILNMCVEIISVNESLHSRFPALQLSHFKDKNLSLIHI